MVRTWAEMRRTYVSARMEELQGQNPPREYQGNWRQYHKDQAHREFNEFVQSEKDKAAEAARTA